MSDVDVISAVSGGSIVAAFYVCQMEKRLRSMEPSAWADRTVRLALHEAIAADFLTAVDHNLRTRALIFTPFYHPWLFVKTLVLRAKRASARSELIHAEYDRWFYDGDNIDQLPSVTPARAQPGAEVLHGPKVLLNATSLLTGQRRWFCREPNSGLNEMKRSNQNALSLSRVVGASSGVPVLFPPTSIFGDMLVDGGIADNQGIEGLLPPEGITTDPDPDIILVSDASGQMDPVNTIGSRAVTVGARVNSILQFQVRNKLIDLLVCWRDRDNERREFAFTHLYLNLKDRGLTDRLPSEMIPGVARIRTDLDQFSFIERESLMYHGYTLIDAQIQKYCPRLMNAYPPSAASAMAVPPLFRSHPRPSSATLSTKPARGEEEERADVRNELELGATSFFILRSLRKFPWRVGACLAGWAGVSIAGIDALFSYWPDAVATVQHWIGSLLTGVTRGIIGESINVALRASQLPELAKLIDGASKTLGTALCVAAILYLVAFPTFLVVRLVTSRADRARYHKLAGVLPSTTWKAREAVAPGG
jgi:predicted acylesterase/phospholipase RssA